MLISLIPFLCPGQETLLLLPNPLFPLHRFGSNASFPPLLFFSRGGEGKKFFFLLKEGGLFISFFGQKKRLEEETDDRRGIKGLLLLLFASPPRYLMTAKREHKGEREEGNPLFSYFFCSARVLQHSRRELDRTEVFSHGSTRKVRNIEEEKPDNETESGILHLIDRGALTVEMEMRGGKLSRDFTLVTRENGIKALFFWNSSSRGPTLVGDIQQCFCE